MRRGLGNPRRDTATTFVANRAAQLKQRFAIYRTLLQTEGPSKFFEPLPSVKREQIRKYAEKQRLNAPPDKAQAWYTWEMMQDKFIEGQDYDYQKRFMTWLMGKGLEEDHKLTPWGREAHALMLPEVRAWIEQMIDAASITENYLAKLLFRGPQSLEEYAIYYKYLLHMEEYLTTDDAWIFIEFPELYNGYHLQRGPDAVMPGPPQDKTDNFELGKMGKEGQERIMDIRETAGKLTQKFNDVALAAAFKAASAEERRRMEKEREREIEELAAQGMDIADADQDVKDAAVQAQKAADLQAKAAAIEAKQQELRILREARKRAEEEEQRKRDEAAEDKRRRRKEKKAQAKLANQELIQTLQSMREELVQRRAAPMQGVESTNPAAPVPQPVEPPQPEPPQPEPENPVAEEQAAMELEVAEEIPEVAPEPEQLGLEEFAEEDWYVGPPEPMEGVVEGEKPVQAPTPEQKLTEAKAAVAENVSERAADLVGLDRDGSAPMLDAFQKLEQLTEGLGLRGNMLARTFNVIEDQLRRQTRPKEGGEWTTEQLRDAMTVYFRRYSKRIDALLLDKFKGKYSYPDGTPNLALLGTDLRHLRESAFTHLDNRPLLKGTPVLAVKKHQKTPGESSEEGKQKAKKVKTYNLTMADTQTLVAGISERLIKENKAAKALAKAQKKAKPARSKESSDSDYEPSTSSSSSSSESKSPKK